MRLHLNLTPPDYGRRPRWFKVWAERGHWENDDWVVPIRGKLCWWWKLALYGRLLRSTRISFER
ncbi:MAG TPA: hypothetical protein VGF95_14555 [Solirubrobacteraceae bacterium]|jgi:hypothetical protein